ncbi:hypothetical protein GQ457_11G014260 [Hibiscus cannabinus]
MAFLNLVKNFIIVANFGGRVSNNRIVSAVRPRFIQASSKQEARACEKGNNKAKEMTGKAKNRCDSAKEKAEKAKDSVADDSKEAIIKENAEKIKQSMNKRDW